MKKRLLGLILALVMAVAVAPMALASAGGTTTDSDTGKTEDKPFTSVEAYRNAIGNTDTVNDEWDGVDVYVEITGETFDEFGSFSLPNVQKWYNPPKLHLTLKNCTFIGNTAGDNTNRSFMYLPNCVELEIDGCQFSTGDGTLDYGINWNLIQITGATVSITNSSFSGNYVNNAIKLNQRNGSDDAATDVKPSLPAGGGSMTQVQATITSATITNCTFSGENAIIALGSKGKGEEATLSNGAEYNKASPSTGDFPITITANTGVDVRLDYLASSRDTPITFTVEGGTAVARVKVADGSVKDYFEVTSGTGVAQVGNTTYPTLRDAVIAVSEGSYPAESPATITLQKSTTGAGVSVPSGSNIIFDLNNCVYTIDHGVGSIGTETNGFQFLRDSNITIKNGTIIPDGFAQLGILIQNYSNLTLENVVLDGRQLADLSGAEYTLSNNNGEIALNSGTVIYSRTDNDIAMDVCWAASYQEGARVTVNKGVVINGDVELGLWGQKAYDNDQSVLTVNGGTINGELTIQVTDSNYNSKDEAIAAVKSNVTIAGGTFGNNIDAYLGSDNEATAKVTSDGQYSYYKTVDEAQQEAQPGDLITDLSGIESNAEQFNIVLDDGTGTIVTMSEYEGAKITLPAPTRPSHAFLGWSDGSRTYQPGETATISGNTTFTALWQYIPPADPSYQITIPATANGTVTVSPTSAKEDQVVTITATPNRGYELTSLTVTDRNGNRVTVTANPDGTYRFVMPASQVTVSAVFAPAQLPFTDVTEANWYYDEVYYVWANGLMQGTSATTFGPGVDTTRAMVVTILWRLEGEPASGYDMDYSDVAGGAWYADAVRWATEHGIVNGSEGQFYPGGIVTREQLAAMLYRYAQYKGYDLTAGGDLSGFADAGAVSGWAETSLAWAVGQGLIQGSDSQVDPQGSAIRAQTAAILMRFMENVAN